MSMVLIPQRNAPDLDDVPEKVREALDIHLMTDVKDVLALALEPAAEPATLAAA
ncbi:MAG TPA: S16 family serine protease [Streptosporangiaceae bacterium]|nr:S16 family serine protease [Streptosporangiaceae bacterium]